MWLYIDQIEKQVFIRIEELGINLGLQIRLKNAKLLPDFI